MEVLILDLVITLMWMAIFWASFRPETRAERLVVVGLATVWTIAVPYIVLRLSLKMFHDLNTVIRRG